MDYQAVYINLDRRKDRREHIEAVLDSLEIPTEHRTRFPAVVNSSGWVGCTQSHYAVIAMAKEKGWPAVLVLEDDFQLTVSQDTFHSTLKQIQTPYDVLLLAYHVEASEEIPGTSLVRRAFSAQAASAYIVPSHFYDRLLQTFQEAVTGALAGGNHWDYIHDQYWKRLQADRTTTWLYCTPRLGIQKEGYSDLSQKMVSYGV